MDVKRLTHRERDELESLMELHDPHSTGPMHGSITRVHGFLTSILSGPLVMPSEWIPVVFGDDESAAWATIEQAERAMNLLMRFYNEIASDLQPGGRFSVLIDRMSDGTDTFDSAEDWCIGYVLGFALRENEWQEAMDAPELQKAFPPILLMAHREKPPEIDAVKNPETYAAMLEILPNCVLEIHEWWRKSHTVRRAAPKVSANAPCPCGSGKKYKRCCSPLRVL